jgi:hypothetical protein
VTDTGTQLFTIAESGSQFFIRISAPSTGVLTSPYRERNQDCLQEVQALMTLGTSNQRRILARVTPERQLEFYEQPDPTIPLIYVDGEYHFYTMHGTVLEPYIPPIGQFAQYIGSSQIILPFDSARTPTCFIARVRYWPQTGKVRVDSDY